MKYNFIIEYKNRRYEIPQYMRAGLINYIEKGEKPGDFLVAVLSNKLDEAVARADGNNIDLLPAYVVFLHNQAPSGCHGSSENVKEWIEKKRKEIDYENEKEN